MTNWEIKRIRQREVYISPEGDLYRRTRTREKPDRLIDHAMPGLSPTPVRRMSASECSEVFQPLEGFE